MPHPIKGSYVINLRRVAPTATKLVSCVHQQLGKLKKAPFASGSEEAVVQGAYDYYHYGVDGFADDGWGCAYRSLQTVLSWFRYQRLFSGDVPSLRKIQQILSVVDPEKAHKANFVGSKEWIGSYEVAAVLRHYMPSLECVLLHLESGEELRDKENRGRAKRALLKHFRNGGSPVMVGGAAYAYTILGIEANFDSGDVQYLILDPHYSSATTDLKVVASRGCCAWKLPEKHFAMDKFYNICIPRCYDIDTD